MPDSYHAVIKIISCFHTGNAGTSWNNFCAKANKSNHACTINRENEELLLLLLLFKANPERSAFKSDTYRIDFCAIEIAV